MVQGCTSDAGKSVLVAGLCRVLMRRGCNVAPFKPQNMALNSAVTASGGEIGRAQAVQALAAGIEPSTDMNPVLLKPNSDTGAQVIIHGKAISEMEAAAFHDYKATAMNAVLSSHQRLVTEYQYIIVEGAGSPAEINLREGDIANMGFAEAVDCPVVIVADIDKGGVFAHLVGTLELLSASEQARVSGFVINKFRGDIALLQPGLDWLKARTGKPVLGVLPYLHGLHIAAEDAVEIDQALAKDGPILKVIVPVLPRISNHTDFDVLRLHPQVDLVFVGPDDEIPAADLIVLPGSKSVRSDLQFLHTSLWVTAIKKHLRYGGKLLGICGGFQMLGESIADPSGIEGPAGVAVGLGFLAFDTELASNKQLRQVSGEINSLLNGQSSSFDNGTDVALKGYEIHAGNSKGEALRRPFAILNDAVGGIWADGAISEDRSIVGTYVHGVFDEPQACENLLKWAGLTSVTRLDYAARCERDINRLADAIEQSLDLTLLERVD